MTEFVVQRKKIERSDRFDHIPVPKPPGGIEVAGAVRAADKAAEVRLEEQRIENQGQNRGQEQDAKIRALFLWLLLKKRAERSEETSHPSILWPLGISVHRLSSLFCQTNRQNKRIC